MKKYWSYFKTCTKSESAYKADFILSMLINSIFFFIYFAVWKAVYTGNGISEINTYTLSTTITYYFVTSLIFRIEISNYVYLGWMVWMGEFTNDLVKPWDPKFIYGILALSDVVINFLLYLPVMAVIYIFTNQYIQIPSFINLFYFLITLGLSIVLSLVINLGLNSLVFFFGDQESNIGLINYIIAFMAGAFFPLAFLPDALSKIFMILPFKYIFNVPVNVFLGRFSTGEVFRNWAYMAIWILVFYIAFYFLYAKGLKHYTGTGR